MMKRRPSSLPLLTLAAFVGVTVVGCGSSSSKSPKKAATTPAAQGAADSTQTPTTPVVTTDVLAIKPLDAAQSFTFAANQPVQIQYQLSGDAGRDIIVGLMQTPKGATLTTSGESVTFNWQAPVSGTYTIQFILRDRAKCVAAETSASVCEINVADYGTLGAKAYDVASDNYSLQIGTGTGTGTTGLGNGNLINQIISLLGGNAGGTGTTGTGTAGGLGNVLSGLSNGQLTQLLSNLQNGGGGGGLAQLLSLLQGFGLADDQN